MAALIPLWLDCDPGHDDAFAILLAAHHPTLSLLGVSTVHGNAPLDRTTSNAGSVLTAIGRSDIHVYPGARKPFCRSAVHAGDIHGATGLDGTDLLPAPSAPPITNVPAVLAMREALLAQPPDTAWLVATGTLTNVAILFAAFPELATHLRGLSIMGGAIGDNYTAAPLGKVGAQVRIGNITPYAEFNIYCDPEAAKAIFTNPVLAGKTTLIPLDVTHLARATSDMQQRLLHGNRGSGDAKPSALRQMLHDLLGFFAQTYDTVFGLSDGPPLHDPLAVAVLLNSLKFDDRSETDEGGERWVVDVVTEGEHASEHAEGVGTVGERAETNMLGRTVLRRLEPGLRTAENQGVRVPRGLDVPWFWEEMLGAVETAEEHLQTLAAKQHQ